MSVQEFKEEILDSYFYPNNVNILIIERKLSHNGETPFRCDIAVDAISKVYICSVNDLKNMTFIHELSQFQSTGEDSNICAVAFNESERKWYGWSRRAFYGFEIGSEVKRGDCAYTPIDKEDFIQSMIKFYDLTGEVFAIDDSPTENLINTTYSSKFTYVEDNYEDKSIILNYIFTRFNSEGEIFELENNSIKCQLPTIYGRGEWTALTLDDAKQMAIDYAKGVS